jgi:hypothetical protein
MHRLSRQPRSALECRYGAKSALYCRLRIKFIDRRHHMINPKSRSDISDTATTRRRKPLSSENPIGIRIITALEGRGLKWLSGETGIPDSTLSGYVESGISSAQNAVLIGRALDRSVEWLMTGADRPIGDRRTIAAVEDADWVALPFYNLRNVDDSSLGNPEFHTPVRRDWLSTTVRVTSNLWLTRLISDYRAAELYEDMTVLCRSIDLSELAEGYLCLWRYNGKIVTGRFSVIADALAATRIRTNTFDSEYSSQELVISSSQIADGDEGYRLVGRILSTFMRPI